ncbi:MAG: ABC transporter ATP-binding protein [Alphaproteobacteria bacterium]|nr:ABC transporter ATP-binding protein [Alphaproteobacteria bacterium]
MSLIKVDNLQVFVDDNRRIIHGIDFALNEGEILGIVGESGSGKSLTALSLLGLKKCAKSSSINILGQQMNGASEQEWRQIRGNQIGFIFQEPMSSLNPLHKIGHQIAESIILHRGTLKKQAMEEALELLNLVGIAKAEERINSYPFELSGGQRQRVMIAMAIANKPKILIADEPTTALDVTVQAQIIKLLLDLRKKLNMSIIFISHDLSLIRKIADNVMVMKDGKIVEYGNTKDIFEHPQKDYTKTLINSVNILNKNKKLSQDIALCAQNIKVSFPLKKNFFGKVVSKVDAVDNISFSLPTGATLGVVGESGSGKTTLGLSIVGLTPYKGDFYYQNQPINTKNRRTLCKQIQMVFQDPYNSLNPRMTIEQIVGEGLIANFKELSKQQRQEKILSAITEVGLTKDDLAKYPHQFSGGQRQRIAIARALVMQPRVLILDEPTSALDVSIQAQILSLLKQIQKAHNMSYIFISHDMQAIRSVSDRIMVMKDGKIVEEGEVETIFNSPQRPYTQQLINAVI